MGNFGGGYKKADHNRMSLKDAISKMRSRRFPFPGILVATTVRYQPEAEKDLRENGFIPVWDFHNDVHGNLVTFWVRARKDDNIRLRPEAIEAFGTVANGTGKKDLPALVANPEEHEHMRPWLQGGLEG